MELTGEGGQDRDGSVQMGTPQGRKSCQSQHKVCAQLLPCFQSCGKFLQLRELIHKPRFMHQQWER